MLSQDLIVVLGQIHPACADPDEAQLRHHRDLMLGPVGERFYHCDLNGNSARGRCGLEPASDLIGDRERHHPSLCAIVSAPLLT